MYFRTFGCVLLIESLLYLVMMTTTTVLLVFVLLFGSCSKTCLTALEILKNARRVIFHISSTGTNQTVILSTFTRCTCVVLLGSVRSLLNIISHLQVLMIIALQVVDHDDKHDDESDNHHHGCTCTNTTVAGIITYVPSILFVLGYLRSNHGRPVDTTTTRSDSLDESGYLPGTTLSLIASSTGYDRHIYHTTTAGTTVTTIALVSTRPWTRQIVRT
jgi:hypothetical protein